MKRAAITFAIAAGLAIGTAIPTSAIGETQVTLNCSDGTSTALVVGADTLADLTHSVQAMIDYPAGLTCSLAKNPLGALFGGIAVASPGRSPFIVGGGRWLVPCGLFPPPGGGGGSIDSGMVAKLPGSWWSSLLSLGSVPIDDTNMVWVNIAVNVHQADDGTFFGTLNETIPENQFCPDISTGTTFAVGPSHFTSKPQASPTGCFKTSTPSTAHVVSHVTQTSGLAFPLAGDDTDIHFSFIDNGNPSTGTRDELRGPPAVDDSECIPDNITPPVSGVEPYFDLVHGNITLHPKP